MATTWRSAVAVLGLAAVLGPIAVRGAEPKAFDAKVAMETLKSLAGEWVGKGADGKELGTNTYRVVSNGSAVLQTQMPGTEHEMISIYHLDGDDLVMTHYCAIGNQPKLKLDLKASTADDLKFEYCGGTNVDPESDMHIHAARIKVKGKGVEEDWTAFAGGKSAGTMTFVLSRK